MNSSERKRISIGSHTTVGPLDADEHIEVEKRKGEILTIVQEAYFPRPDFLSSELSLEKGDIVLDVGAGVGSAALYFSLIVGESGHVFAFEPVFYEALCETLKSSGRANATPLPYGVSDQPGVAEFAVTGAGIDSRMAEICGGANVRNICPSRTVNKITACITTIDAFCAERRLEKLDLIKLEIEGAVEPALRGAAVTLQTLRPQLSISSYHTDQQGEVQHPKMVRFLRDQGYRVVERDHQHIYAVPAPQAPAPPEEVEPAAPAL